MKCIIILALLLGISSAFRFNLGLRGLQREVRVNGERRIFIRNARTMLIFNVPKNNPAYLEMIGIRDGKLIRKVVMDDMQNVIVDVRDTGAMENFGMDEMNEDRPTTMTMPTENRQMRVLLDIFRDYQGFSGEGAFFEMLKKVKQSVDTEELHPMIYDALKELEVQPNPQPDTQRRNDTTRKLEEVSEKVAKRIEEVVKSDDSNENAKREREAKFKVLEAMRAAQQIEWLQKLLAMQRYQRATTAQTLMTQQEDPVKRIDSLIMSTDKYGDRNLVDLRQMLIKTNIQEIQREIIRLQLIREQLQNQQDFLGEQKQQIRMQKILAYHQGAQTDQMREMNDAYRQMKEQEKRLVREQITVLKKIHELQKKLILQNQELDQNLSKEDDL